MAVAEYTVMWDLAHAGPGYDAIKSGVAFKKGETVPAWEPTTGLRGQVFTGKLARVKAESVEEALLIASEAYGSRGGVGTGALTSNTETKSA